MTSFCAFGGGCLFWIHYPWGKAFTGPSLIHSHRKSLALGETKSIIDGVEFDTIVREWSCKWSPGGSKASLLACQMALEAVFDDLNDIEGFLFYGLSDEHQALLSRNIEIFEFLNYIGQEQVERGFIVSMPYFKSRYKKLNLNYVRYSLTAVE